MNDRDTGTGGVEHYGGAGDGQCCAIKLSDGQRCTNGVYGSDMVCGTHKRTKSDLKLAPAQDDREWRRCPECGWQPCEWEAGDPPFCSWCSCEFPADAERWQDAAVAQSGGGLDE